MKTIVFGICAVLLAWGQVPSRSGTGIENMQKITPTMITPTITHHDEKTVQHYDHVEIICPEGYEGHFVDTQVGFDGRLSNIGTSLTIWQSSGEMMHVVCFSKEFMDKVRKNPELTRVRPEIRPA